MQYAGQYIEKEITKKPIDKIYDEIAKLNVKERKRQNTAQERLAPLYVCHTHMGLIKHGRREPTILTLHKIISTLNLSLSELFKGL